MSIIRLRLPYSERRQRRREIRTRKQSEAHIAGRPQLTTFLLLWVFDVVLSCLLWSLEPFPWMLVGGIPAFGFSILAIQSCSRLPPAPEPSRSFAQLLAAFGMATCIFSIWGISTLVFLGSIARLTVFFALAMTRAAWPWQLLQFSCIAVPAALHMRWPDLLESPLIDAVATGFLHGYGLVFCIGLASAAKHEPR